MPINVENGSVSDFYFIKADSQEDIHDSLLQVITDRIPKRFGFGPVKDIQVLHPMNRGGLGVTALNEVLQKYLTQVSRI